MKTTMKALLTVLIFSVGVVVGAVGMQFFMVKKATSALAEMTGVAGLEGLAGAMTTGEGGDRQAQLEAMLEQLEAVAGLDGVTSEAGVAASDPFAGLAGGLPLDINNLDINNLDLQGAAEMMQQIDPEELQAVMEQLNLGGLREMLQQVEEAELAQP